MEILERIAAQISADWTLERVVLLALCSIALIAYMRWFHRVSQHMTGGNDGNERGNDGDGESNDSPNGNRER